MSKNSRALLLVAHGSRRTDSNDEIRELTARLREQASDRFASITCGFLELASPSIPDGIQECIDRGAQEVIVLPYFLSAGRHVVADIPELVAVKQQQYPDLSIKISGYLGSAEGIPNLLLSLVE